MFERQRAARQAILQKQCNRLLTDNRFCETTALRAEMLRLQFLEVPAEDLLLALELAASMACDRALKEETRAAREYIQYPMQGSGVV